MKKVAVFLLLMVLVVGVGCAKSITEADGMDWLQWHPQQKLMFLYGYTAAIWASTQGIDLAYDGEVVAPMKRMKEFMEGLLRVRYQSIVERMDRFYMSAGNLRIPIWRALWMIDHPEFTITRQELIEGTFGDNG